MQSPQSLGVGVAAGRRVGPSLAFWKAFPTIPLAYVGIPEAAVGIFYFMAQLTTIGSRHPAYDFAVGASCILLWLISLYIWLYWLYCQGIAFSQKLAELASGLHVVVALVFKVFKYCDFLVHLELFRSDGFIIANTFLASFIMILGVAGPLLREAGK